MGRLLKYFLVVVLLALAGLAIYAQFAPLPAPSERVEEPIDLDAID